MSDFFEQKEKSLIHFRENINKFLKDSKSFQIKDQLTIDVITQILQTIKIPGLVANNGRINADKLYEILHSQEGGGHTLNRSDFTTIFGQKNQIKISQISNALKKYDLQSFDLEAEIKKNLFDRSNEMKISQLNKMMLELGWGQLNAKNKQIVAQCFDFNGDKKINSEDINQLIDIIGQQKFFDNFCDEGQQFSQQEQEFNKQGQNDIKKQKISKRCSIIDL